MQQLVAESGKTYGMQRTLGAFQLVMLGIGAIVGAGIYVYVGVAAGQHAGPATVLSFAIAGLACICVAFCYAELAAAIPISGSSYTFTYATLGEFPAFLVGGILLMSYCLSVSAVAAGWSGYMQSFLFNHGIQVPAIISKNFGHVVTLADGTTITALIDLPAVLIVTLISLLVFLGTELSAMVTTIIVIIKMTVLFAFIAIGATKIDLANWQPFIPANTGTFGEFGWSGVCAGAGAILMAYTGFDMVATAAQETKNPQRNLPIGIIGSLVICILLYIAVSAVLTGVAPYTELNVAQPVAVAVSKMGMPNWFTDLVNMGAIVGLTSVILAMIYASVRITFAMTTDGLLPQKLANIHPKYRTPYLATIAAGALIVFFAGFVPMDKIAKSASSGLIVTLIIVSIVAIYLRYKHPELKREFKCPMMPFIPLVGTTIFAVMLYSITSKEIFIMEMIWIMFLTAIYFLYSRHNSICQNSSTK